MKHWSLFGRLFEGEVADYQEVQDIYNTVMSFFCVVTAGFCAGLTMGLLSLDPTKMQLKAMTGSSWEKKAALEIIPVIKQHHLLLVTLLLANSLANEALPVFLGALVPNYVAVIISVTLVLIFGEILPSAVFTGPNQLYMAAKMVPIVKMVMLILWPISYPISRLLDYFFGEEEASTVFSRNDFEALIQLQTMHKQPPVRKDNSNDGRSESSSPEKNDDKNSESNYGSINNANNKELLSSEEVKIMSGILNLSRQTVLDAMIPISNAFMVSDITKLGFRELSSILNSGFSRIPVFHNNDRRNILGFILVKALVVLSPSDYIGVDSLDIREPIILKPNVTLLEALSIFRKGQKTLASRLRPKSPDVHPADGVHHSHIALISNDPIKSLNMMRSFRLMSRGKKNDTFLTAEYVREIMDADNEAMILGIVTLEDVIERIIQEEIIDETDVVMNQKPSMGSSLAIHKKFSTGSKTSSSRRNSVSNREQSGSFDSYDSEMGMMNQREDLNSSRRRSLNPSNLSKLGFGVVDGISESNAGYTSYQNNENSNFNSNVTNGNSNVTNKNSSPSNSHNTHNNSDLSFASALNSSGGALFFDDDDDDDDDDSDYDEVTKDHHSDANNRGSIAQSTSDPVSGAPIRRKSINKGGDRNRSGSVEATSASANDDSRSPTKRRSSIRRKSVTSGGGDDEDAGGLTNENSRLLHDEVDK